MLLAYLFPESPSFYVPVSGEFVITETNYRNMGTEETEYEKLQKLVEDGSTVPKFEVLCATSSQLPACHLGL